MLFLSVQVVIYDLSESSAASTVLSTLTAVPLFRVRRIR